MRSVIPDILSGSVQHRIFIVAGVGSLLFLLAVVLFKANTVLVFGAMVALGAGIALLVWPDVATLCFLFVIYSNIAVVACQARGVSTSFVAALWPLLCIPYVLHIFARRQRMHVDYPFLIMLVYTGCLFLSFFAARDKDVAIKWIATYILEGVVLYFLIVNVIRDRDMLKNAVGTILVAGVLLGSLTLYQDVFGRYENQFGGLAQRELRFETEGETADETSELIRQRKQIRRVHRADGPFGDPNYYAQIMIVLLPLGLVSIFNQCSRKRRLVAGGALLIITSGLLLTYSRGAFVTLCLLTMIAVMMRIIRLRLVLMAIGAILIVVIIVSPGYFTRIGTIRGVEGFFKGDDANDETDSVILSRMTEMTAALNVYLDHPIVGVGPGQYKLYSLDYMDDIRLLQKQHDKMRAAHSLYFQLAAETGTLGLVIFMCIPSLMLIGLWNERKRWIGIRPELAYLPTAMFMSILAFLGTGVFLTYAYQRYFWIIMALAGVTVRVSRLEFSEFQMKEAMTLSSGTDRNRIHGYDGNDQTQKH